VSEEPTDLPEGVVSLDDARNARRGPQILERRKGTSFNTRITSVEFSREGVGVLRAELGDHELAWPMTSEESRELSRQLLEASTNAKPWRERHEGIVRLVWCRTDGSALHDGGCTGGVPAVITGRVPGSVVLQPCPDFEHTPWREPKWGWPPAGSYSLATGAHHATKPRRRHWRIRRRDLEHLTVSLPAPPPSS